MVTNAARHGNDAPEGCQSEGKGWGRVKDKGHEVCGHYLEKRTADQFYINRMAFQVAEPQDILLAILKKEILYFNVHSVKKQKLFILS